MNARMECHISDGPQTPCEMPGYVDLDEADERAAITERVGAMTWWELHDHFDDLDALAAELRRTPAGRNALDIVIAAHQRLVIDAELAS